MSHIISVDMLHLVVEQMYHEGFDKVEIHLSATNEKSKPYIGFYAWRFGETEKSCVKIYAERQ